MTRALALRLFGATALLAVGSFWQQVIGLHGARGLMPAAQVIEALERNGLRFEVPTLLFLSSTDAMLHALCGGACAAAVAVMLGFAPRPALWVLWGCWLSLVTVCSPFLNFQWDVLLLEAAAIFSFYAPGGWGFQTDEVRQPPNAAANFMLAWLSCKLAFESGVVKLASTDPSWRDLTALTYHWWSQPLPTWSSVVLNELPMPVQKLLCASTFVLELPVPLLALGPARLRRFAGLGLIGLQAGLFAAGNYSYYNVLAAVIAVPLLGAQTSPAKRWHWGVAGLVAAAGVAAFFHRLPTVVQRFDTINAYGAFAHMTKTRPEIIVEGSNDGATWQPYVFRWKPGRLDARPRWVAPLQPRLDWQMWFAALGSCGQNEFVWRLQQHLLQGTPEVLALLADPSEQPFASPPKYLRSVLYEYRFAPWPQRGVWWRRELRGPYCPPLTLTDDGGLRRASEVESAAFNE